ncbi:aa3-type cytochrome c oxidase subunit IV [Neoroseomonas soli]|uniref:Aa3-type cytochrome c oxidase subunit IV n=1 Tax=Neoroseomonas soli TaxID=1081025 RepID=A0A9X9WXQ7_9PROT|nr:aa3-type cytochrome c oxidase subunit IV [Neoroseomonas soli]MBR0671936.1 aa3-type cytochrome c oxidase subunit IV [Neoroseomonas soli]
MAEQQTYEFVEVKAADILAERQQTWGGFTSFLTWSLVTIAILLVLIYAIWG